jgi:hypothetical protein
MDQIDLFAFHVLTSYNEPNKEQSILLSPNKSRSGPSFIVFTVQVGNHEIWSCVEVAMCVGRCSRLLTDVSFVSFPEGGLFIINDCCTGWVLSYILFTSHDLKYF